MELTEDILNEVKAGGSIQYHPSQIAEILGLDPREVAEWMKDREHPFFQAYIKGKYEAETEFRASVKSLAKSGSSPAQTMYKKLIEENRLKNLNL